jgi:predicted ATPase/class 3 adenylate cyclase
MATRVKPEPPARPTGTVTFAFTDIEGSTQRWDRDRAAMQDAVRRHDSLVQTAIAAHDGYVFKTIGDAFCAAFWRPEDAVAAILDAQRALAIEDFSAVDGLRVRAAVHTGTADERDGDYFGPALNRVARLLMIGHGGQVLVSGITTDLVQGALPSQASLRDLGAHRLKDLARPEHVYQLLAPDLIGDFPPLRSLDHLSNNLPAQVSSFVGREAEIAAIDALIETHRLVTLVGSGGVGKTRLSLQVAANLLDGSGDGVWFIELAPLTRGDYIPSTVALALGLTLAPEGDPVEHLVRALKEKHALLVFDNCEHLVEPAACVISAVLHGAPKVKVLASSRQGLGVSGEATYQVPSLDLPTGVGLFAERARAASATFSLADENAPIIADICRRLDGIPLAIELAAARVKMLSLKQLRDRLDERFRVLTGGSRDVLPRQQTLRALIDWSHDLLDERERALFRRLGIFVDGFTLEGAVAVGSPCHPERVILSEVEGRGIDEVDVFDVLASLVDKSLVLAEPRGDAVRYRLLESTRAYAAEKLDAVGERGLVAGRHLRYLRDRFAGMWERWQQRVGRSADIDAALQTDLDDVRLALGGALAPSSVIDGGELLANVEVGWQAIGLEAEGIEWCETYLEALPAGELRLRTRLSTTLAFFFSGYGHKARAFDLAAQALEHARKGGDASLLARTLLIYATEALSLNRLDDAEIALAESEAIPGTSGFPILSLRIRARFSELRGDLDTATRMYEQIRRLREDFREDQSVAANLAEIEHARGRTPQAIAIVRETLPAARSNADKHLLCSLLQNLAGYLVAVDDLPGAVAGAREAIGIYAAREPDDAHVAIGIEHLALVFALRAEVALAATLEGYADAALARYAFPREFTETTTHDRLTALLREGLAPDELARLSVEGAALTREAAIALALAEP